jgi:trimeric autotransporter adhesin
MTTMNTAWRNSGGRVAAIALVATLAACDGSPTQPSPPGPSCTFQVSSPSTSVAPGGGTVNVTVTTTANCSWSAQSNSPWLSITSGASGTGNGVAVIAGTANPDTSSRNGSVTVAQQNISLTQPGRDVTCEYTTSPDSQRFGADGGTGRVQVTATDGCRWTATVDATWITLSPTEGTGNGEVTFRVAEWNSVDERSATIRVANRTTIVRQDRDVAACTYSVDPVEFSLHWHHTTGEIHVQTTAGCPWNASSSDAWLNVPNVETTGSGNVTFGIPQLVEQATRRAPVKVRWPTQTAGQNVYVNQEGCYFAIGEKEKIFTRDGGKGFLLVFGTPMTTACSIGCPWTVTSDVPWIQIQGSGSGAGDDGIFYVVAANPGPGPRTGRITAAGYTLVITQSF